MVSWVKISILKKVLLFFFFIFTFYFLLSPPTYAQPTGCNNAGPGGTLQCGASGIIQAQQLVTRLINVSVTLAFMALTVWLAWSALKLFITSGGDPKALSHAWSSVTWAFMGIFFLALAWFVMKLIFAVTGANVTQYCLGFPPYCL